jgi:hypothetical protein
MDVLMQFGDGNHQVLPVEADDPGDAVQEAKDWVLSHAWFEVQDDQGQVLATTNLLRAGQLVGTSAPVPGPVYSPL